MKSMKKRTLAWCAAAGILFAQGALAAKAIYVEATGDTAYHLSHLLAHEDETLFTVTADLVKLRIAPASNKLHGRLMMGETFEIIDHYKDWVQIEIVSARPDNPDSCRGMTGWVEPAYIDCGCDEAAYYAQETIPQG